MTGFSLGEAFKGISGGMKEGEAVLTILVGAVLADGQTVEEESSELSALELRSRTLREFKRTDPARFEALHRELPVKMRDPAELMRLIEEAASSLMVRTDGRERVVAKSMFSHAADIIFSDSKVPEREQRFLETLATRLKLEQAEAMGILTFIRDKNEF